MKSGGAAASDVPPFAGTPAELEALVQWLMWNHDAQPESWPVSEDAETLRQIREWMDEAGTAPATDLVASRE